MESMFEKIKKYWKWIAATFFLFIFSIGTIFGKRVSKDSFQKKSYEKATEGQDSAVKIIEKEKSRVNDAIDSHRELLVRIDDEKNERIKEYSQEDQEELTRKLSARFGIKNGDEL